MIVHGKAAVTYKAIIGIGVMFRSSEHCPLIKHFIALGEKAISDKNQQQGVLDINVCSKGVLLFQFIVII